MLQYHLLCDLFRIRYHHTKNIRFSHMDNYLGSYPNLDLLTDLLSSRDLFSTTDQLLSCSKLWLYISKNIILIIFDCKDISNMLLVHCLHLTFADLRYLKLLDCLRVGFHLVDSNNIDLNRQTWLYQSDLILYRHPKTKTNVII